MKLIIDLPTEAYEGIKKGSYTLYASGFVRKAIMEGKTLPEEATNKDVLEAIFPDQLRFNEDNSDSLFIVKSKKWWKEPYKDGEGVLYRICPLCGCENAVNSQVCENCKNEL